MEELSLSRLRGAGLPEDAGRRETLLALGRKRGRFRLVTAARYLGASVFETKRLAERLAAEGLLEERRGIWRLRGTATARERFDAALGERRGAGVTTAELRELCGISDSRLSYYIKGAEAAGRLIRIRHGRYRVEDR